VHLAAHRLCRRGTRLRGAGVTIDDPTRCAEQLREALALPGPVVIEAVVDPHEPPMPPYVTVKQAAHFAQSLARGTPAAGRRVQAAHFAESLPAARRPAGSPHRGLPGARNHLRVT
jgi:hypothetical protein